MFALRALYSIAPCALQAQCKQVYIVKKRRAPCLSWGMRNTSHERAQIPSRSTLLLSNLATHKCWMKTFQIYFKYFHQHLSRWSIALASSSERHGIEIVIVSPELSCNCGTIQVHSTSLIYPFQTDINECAVNNGGCQHECKNTLGSFMCRCSDGYFEDIMDPSKCIDIDECAEGMPACFDCVNTPGR